ncbi:MAG: flavodoxin [Bacilli bacterium]|nr:flavodoxin [Bacilli bacterium]
MKIAIRYYTRSKKGNTLKLAKAVSEAAKVEALTIENDLQEETEILFLVNAMYAFDVDNQVKDFLKRNASKIKCLVNVNSAASGASTLKSVKKVTDKLNIPVSDKEYHTVASWLALNRNRPNEDDLNRLKQFVEGVIKQ